MLLHTFITPVCPCTLHSIRRAIRLEVTGGAETVADDPGRAEREARLKRLRAAPLPELRKRVVRTRTLPIVPDWPSPRPPPWIDPSLARCLMLGEHCHLLVTPLSPHPTHPFVPR